MVGARRNHAAGARRRALGAAPAGGDLATPPPGPSAGALAPCIAAPSAEVITWSALIPTTPRAAQTIVAAMATWNSRCIRRRCDLVAVGSVGICQAASRRWTERDARNRWTTTVIQR